MGVGVLRSAEIGMIPFSEVHIDAATALFVDAFAAEPWNEFWPYSNSRRRLSDIVFSPGFFGVAAQRESVLAGFVLGRIEAYRDEEHYFLQEMCVATQFQRQGVGTKLLRYLYAKLEERDCRQIYLLTIRDRGPESFYLRCGFSPARRTGVMVKRLD